MLLFLLLLALIVAGVLTYALAANPKLSTIGEIVFGVALLALLVGWTMKGHLLTP